MERKLNFFKIGLISLTVLMTLLFLAEAISLTVLINYSIVLVSLLFLATIGAAVFNFKENPANGKSFIIGLLSLLTVFGICYGVSNETIDEVTKEVIAGSRGAEAGIYTLYVLIFAAVSVLLYSSFNRIYR